MNSYREKIGCFESLGPNQITMKGLPQLIIIVQPNREHVAYLVSSGKRIGCFLNTEAKMLGLHLQCIKKTHSHVNLISGRRKTCNQIFSLYKF